MKLFMTTDSDGEVWLRRNKKGLRCSGGLWKGNVDTATYLEYAKDIFPKALIERAKTEIVELELTVKGK